jgi:hypothetical protein
MRSWMIGCTTLLADAFLSACGRDIETESNPSWNTHRAARFANLLTLSPNETVELCGPTNEHVAAGVDAIRQWAEPIGRWGHFRVQDCGSGSDLRINIRNSNQYVGLNYLTSNPGLIYTRTGASGNFLKALMLHEIGHSWGLCDQYTDPGRENCATNRPPSPGEVMGGTNASKIRLTPGDIEGIKAAAGLQDVSINQRWQVYLETLPSRPDSPNTPMPNSFNAAPRQSFAKLIANRDGNLELLVSGPSQSRFDVCAYSLAGARPPSCAPGSAGFVPAHLQAPHNGRTVQWLRHLNNQHLGFAVTIQRVGQPNVTEYFQLRRSGSAAGLNQSRGWIQ